MQGKTVLITGANQGVGLASAFALGRMGAHLVLVCRNEQKGREAISSLEREGLRDSELIVADLAHQAEVRKVARTFLERHSRLDVLVNNAGVLATTRRTIDGLEQTFAVNHLAYFLLANLLLDVLQASASPGDPRQWSRIVNVASEAHRGVSMNWDDLQCERGRYRPFFAYRQSKLANILFTRELARRIQGRNITANCVHPGVVATGFGRTDGGITALLVRIAQPFFLTAEQGAKTQVYVASSDAVAGVSGKYFDRCKEREPSAAARDESSAARLWTVSEQLVGLPRSSGDSTPN